MHIQVLSGQVHGGRSQFVAAIIFTFIYRLFYLRLPPLTSPISVTDLTIEAPLAGGSGGILRLDGLYESGAEPAVDFIQA